MLESPEPPESPRVTLRDVAKRLGISHVAVSLALRDKGRISPHLGAKIKAAAAEMGYRPEAMARAMAQYRQEKRVYAIHSSIAWINFFQDISPHHPHGEYALYRKGSKAAAEKAGYHLDEYVVNEELPLAALRRILAARNVHGLIVLPHFIPPEWDAFDWSAYAIVRLGFTTHSMQFPIVTSDHVRNTRLAFRKMRERGYRRLGFVSGAQALRKQFLGGWLQAQYTEPEPLRLPPLLLSETDREDDKKALRAWIKKEKPDALFTDIAPLRLLLAEIGYEIPGRLGLAVTSILDGNADAGIDQNPEAIGQAAANFLISQINHAARGPTPNYNTLTVMGQWADGKTLPQREPDSGRKNKSARAPSPEYPPPTPPCRPPSAQ